MDGNKQGWVIYFEANKWRVTLVNSDTMWNATMSSLVSVSYETLNLLVHSDIINHKGVC